MPVPHRRRPYANPLMEADEPPLQLPDDDRTSRKWDVITTIAAAAGILLIVVMVLLA